MLLRCMKTVAVQLALICECKKRISRLERVKNKLKNNYLWLSKLSKVGIFKLRNYSNCVDNKC